MEGANDDQKKTQEQEQMEFENQAKSLAEIKRRRKDIDRDAQLLANRIALLKQEEMKTWKKIEETKKRTGDITGLKKRNEEKVQKVSLSLSLIL